MRLVLSRSAVKPGSRSITLLLKWTTGIAALTYVGLLLLLYLAQRSMMYFPETMRTAPSSAGLPQAAEVTLQSSDGQRVLAWHIPPGRDGLVFIYFHGNGGSLRMRADRFRWLVKPGDGLVALSYRGYAGSSGAPTEDGLIRDAAAAYAFAVERYPPERLVVFGESLGTGVAVLTAAAHRVGAVILQAPFTSTVDLAAARYWFAPVKLLMKDQFRSDAQIGRIHAPLLILHGDEDSVVPIRFGERLYERANQPKRFVRFSGGGHVDFDERGAEGVVRTFLADWQNGRL